MLTEEKRREYDIQLANELAIWNTNLRRCEYDRSTRHYVARELGKCGVAFIWASDPAAYYADGSASRDVGYTDYPALTA